MGNGRGVKVRRPVALAVTMLFLTGGLAVFGGAGAPSDGPSAVAPSQGIPAVSPPHGTPAVALSNGIPAVAPSHGAPAIAPSHTYPISKAPRAMDANEISWGDDVALTDNPTEDGHPQLAVSADGASGVMWSRGGVPSDMMWMKIDSTGQALIPEKVLASSGLPVQESGFLPPCIGVDSHGSYHIVAGPGGGGVYYAKLDSNGDALVDWKSVPSGAVDPGNPALAVSSNDIVHIVYVDSRFGADQRAIVYARLLNDGTLDKDGIRISGASWNCTAPTICTDPMNKVHAAFIKDNWDVYHGVLDNFGNPLPQAPDTLLYQAGITPRFCCDPSGNVWVLWNDRPWTTGILRLMKLDNDGNILAAGPDGTGILLTDLPTCKGFPAIASDSAGNIYALWPDDRNGIAQLYYMRIEPGAENDIGLPDRAICLTNDTGSGALEPDLAIGQDDNLHVAWTDDRSGNREIYYRLGLILKSQAELGMTPEEMYKVMYVHPNQTVSANLTVRNTGNMPDVVNLSLDCYFNWHLDWNVSIGCASFPLGPKSSFNVTVTVSGPLAGLANDYIENVVTAIPASNPLHKCSVSFRTYLEIPEESFLLDCAETSLSAPVGEPAVYSMMVTSVGGQDVELNLTAEGPPFWKCELSSSNITVEASRSLNFTLSVTPPLDASGGDGAYVTVTARSAESPPESKTIRTVTTVNSYLSLDIIPDPAVGYVDPGGNVSFNLTVRDIGNIYDNLQFSALADWGNYSWEVALDEPNLTLRAEGSGVLVLNVTAPKNALAGASLDINLTVSNFERNVSGWCDIPVIVRAVGGIEASVSPDCATAEPGGLAWFSIDIANRANHRVDVNPRDFILPPGWNISLSLLDGSNPPPNHFLSLDVGGTDSIIAAVAVPASALAGWYPITGTLVDGDGQATPVVLNAAVAQRFLLGIAVADPSQSGELGGELEIPLDVTNLGNGNESVGFNWAGLPQDWPRPDFLLPDGAQPVLFTLGPSESVNVTAQFRIPASTPENDATIALYAESSGGIGFGTNLTIHVRKADLVITKVEVASRDIRPGASVQVNVTVANRGEAPAGTVVLDCILNGRKIISVTDSALQAGEVRVETFVWVPREGRNVLEFAADPGNAVCESNETNNAASLVKDVSPGTGLAQSDLLLRVAAASAVLVFVGLVLLFRQRRGQKRPSAPVANDEHTYD